MGLKDLIDFFHQWGPVGVGFAILLFVVGILYKQNIDNYKDRLKEANERVKELNARIERFEREVKDLNDEMNRFLALGMRVQRAMGEATDEIRRTT